MPLAIKVLVKTAVQAVGLCSAIVETCIFLVAVVPFNWKVNLKQNVLMSQKQGNKERVLFQSIFKTELINANLMSHEKATV